MKVPKAVVRDVKPRLYLGNSAFQRRTSLDEAFDYIGVYKAISGSTKLLVKPNFTFPRPVRGVTTSREVLKDALKLLCETGAEVFVGESNGGYGSFTAAEAFAGQGLDEICRETGAQPLNMSTEATELYSDTIRGKRVSVRLPRIVAREFDFTLSMPVLKVHAMTTVSLSMKNLWGCYPINLRLLEHKEIDRKLVLIARLTKARFGVVDALYGLDGHGPMEGEAKFIGKFIASDNLVTLDWACARMMGFNPSQILHLRNLCEFTNGNSLFPQYESNEDFSKCAWEFSLHRNLIDSLSFTCFHSDLLSKVVFNSPLTKPIYKVMRREPMRKIT